MKASECVYCDSKNIKKVKENYYCNDCDGVWGEPDPYHTESNYDLHRHLYKGDENE